MRISGSICLFVALLLNLLKFWLKYCHILAVTELCAAMKGVRTLLYYCEFIVCMLLFNKIIRAVKYLL
jgi:hypothetical protein